MKTPYTRLAVGLGIFLVIGGLLPQIPAAQVYGGIHSRHIWNIIWCAWIFIVIRLLPRFHLPGPMRIRKQVVGLALTCAVLALALRFCIGFLLQDIASSPYDLSPKGIAYNLWNILPFLLACEVLRAHIIGSTYNRTRHRLLLMIGVTLLFALLQINLFKAFTIQNAEELFIFIAKDMLPAIAQSCLLTVLVFGGGARSSALYAGLISGFLHVFPFLPNLPWLAESALGIGFPIMAALFIREYSQREVITGRNGKKESVTGSIALLVPSVAFMWFVVGVFPVYPSVVLTGSMEPEIMPGDVVIIEKFSTEQEIYALGSMDIINFQRGDIVITHRIVEVLYDKDGNISFQTKGDNNDTADTQIVLPNDIKGIVRKAVPKVGLPILWLKGSDSMPKGVVDGKDSEN